MPIGSSESIGYVVQEGIDKQLRAPSLLESTKSNLERAKQEVIRLEELKQLLENNPETQRIIELLGQGKY